MASPEAIFFSQFHRQSLLKSHQRSPDRRGKVGVGKKNIQRLVVTEKVRKMKKRFGKTNKARGRQRLPQVSDNESGVDKWKNIPF